MCDISLSRFKLLCSLIISTELRHFVFSYISLHGHLRSCSSLLHLVTVMSSSAQRSLRLDALAVTSSIAFSRKLSLFFCQSRASLTAPCAVCLYLNRHRTRVSVLFFLPSAARLPNSCVPFHLECTANRLYPSMHNIHVLYISS